MDIPVVAVKKVKISTKKEEPVVKLEEAPIVVVARRVELRRLARLREDLQAADRLRDHIQKDMDDIEGQLASQSKRAK